MGFAVPILSLIDTRTLQTSGLVTAIIQDHCAVTISAPEIPAPPGTAYHSQASVAVAKPMLSVGCLWHRDTCNVVRQNVYPRTRRQAHSVDATSFAMPERSRMVSRRRIL